MRDRVRLRPVTKRDLASLEAWYEEVLRAVHGGIAPAGEPPLGERLDRGGLIAIEVGDAAETAGILDSIANWPDKGWATVDFIALAPGKRGWGYGSEAVRQFESRHSGARFLAELDAPNGLALYFWLRLGYRPARAEEVFWRPWDEGGIIAMVRD